MISRLAKEMHDWHQPLKSVQEYVYLGQLLTEKPTHEKEIHRRVRVGWSAYGRHSQVMQVICSCP